MYFRLIDRIGSSLAVTVNDAVAPPSVTVALVAATDNSTTGPLEIETVADRSATVSVSRYFDSPVGA